MVAIVTGGSRGLGQHIAQGLWSDGHMIAVIHAGPGANLENCLELSNVDISNESDVQGAVTYIYERFRDIDILVNNAAIYRAAKIGETELSDWMACIKVGLTGAFLMTRAVLPLMQRHNYGRIINIGSFSGRLGPSGAVAYNSAKAGLLGLTRTTANEGAKYGITCNLVVPGCVDTGIYNRLEDRIKARLLCITPMNRAATPDEIVWPVRWLCSPEASYISGQVINVDGGIP